MALVIFLEKWLKKKGKQIKTCIIHILKKKTKNQNIYFTILLMCYFSKLNVPPKLQGVNSERKWMHFSGRESWTLNSISYETANHARQTEVHSFDGSTTSVDEGYRSCYP